jgi:hypothetical protein
MVPFFCWFFLAYFRLHFCSSASEGFANRPPAGREILRTYPTTLQRRTTQKEKLLGTFYIAPNQAANGEPVESSQMTLIEIRPQGRACFRLAEVRIFDLTGNDIEDVSGETAPRLRGMNLFSKEITKRVNVIPGNTTYV